MVDSCKCCTGMESEGPKAIRRLNEAGTGHRVSKTSELYRIPFQGDLGNCAVECIGWPRYDGEEFRYGCEGESMLDMTKEEMYALTVVMLKTSVKPMTYGAAHQLNWKKTGLSTASFRGSLVSEASCPTPRCAAAFRFLIANNRYYKEFVRQHKALLQSGASLNISSYDLFIVQKGIECAMAPWLYPTSDFTDTGRSICYPPSTNTTLAITNYYYYY